MAKVIDECSLNPAIQATVEAEPSYQFLRLRPHSPGSYYASQSYSITLGFEALDALVQLAMRHGYEPPVRPR